MNNIVHTKVTDEMAKAIEDHRKSLGETKSVTYRDLLRRGLRAVGRWPASTIPEAENPTK